MNAMPKQWRRALVLRHVDGLGDEALGKALGRAEPEARWIFTFARELLRQHLVAAGCELG
jgi:DNA-directed RNA polymerase specialized sigma24 family protein